jgi:hypothetical protein
MSRSLLAAMLTLVLAAWLLQGCGSSAGKMTTATASTLQCDVAEVVSAADASRWDAAIEPLDQLDADVASAQVAGGLSDERAAQIRAVRQKVLEDLRWIRGPSPTPGGAATMQTTPSAKTSDNGGNSGGNDGQSRKSKEDDQGEEDGGNKSKNDDQGEDGGGNHKGKDKGKKG